MNSRYNLEYLPKVPPILHQLAKIASTFPSFTDLHRAPCLQGQLSLSIDNAQSLLHIFLKHSLHPHGP